MLTVSDTDVLWFVDQALDAMVGILSALGDEMGNTRPNLDGANSPYAILTHCLGVMEFWGGDMVAGRPITRDRAAEFRATGPVGDLVGRVTVARRRLADDMVAMDATAETKNPPRPQDAALPYGQTQGGVLLHVIEELYQHLGQMELTRDILMSR